MSHVWNREKVREGGRTGVETEREGGEGRGCQGQSE